MGSDWEESCDMLGISYNSDTSDFLDAAGVYYDEDEKEYDPDDPRMNTYKTLEEVKMVSMKYPALRFIRKRSDDGSDYYVVK